MEFGIYTKLGRRPEEFNINWMGDKLNSQVKFIQVYFSGKSYLRIGDMFHRNLLTNFLKEKNISSFKTIKNDIGIKIPSVECEDYCFVGAGRLKFIPDGMKLNFYDASSDYINYFKGTNKEHLEDIFGTNNISESKGFLGFPSFLVNLKNPLD